MLVSRAQWVAPLAWLAVVAMLLVIFPPLHIRRLGDSARTTDGAGLSDATQISTAYWNRLLGSSVHPQDLSALVRLLSADPQAAQKLGHSADVGGQRSYLVAGEARVSRVDDSGMWLDVGASQDIRVVLLTGPVFGSAIRDATGLVPMGRLNFSQFNAISQALDLLSEAQGRELLRSGLKPGSILRVLAAGDVDESGANAVFELSPIRVSRP